MKILKQYRCSFSFVFLHLNSRRGFQLASTMSLARLLLLVLIAATPLSLSLAQDGIRERTNNLIPNAIFESGTIAPFGTANNGTLAIDSTHAYSGSHSLKHTSSGSDSYTNPWYGTAIAIAKGGDPYQFSAMVFADNYTNVQLHLSYLDDQSNVIETHTANFAATPVWRRISLQSISPVGTKQVAIRLDNDGLPGSSVWWDGLYLVLANDMATFVSQDVPSTLEAGERQTVTVIFRNTGSTVWTAGENYRLVSQNPPNNHDWGLGTLSLEEEVSVFPSQTKAFQFEMIAPKVEGTYNFQWQMQNQNADWFGDTSANMTIQVVDTIPPVKDGLSVSSSVWQVDGNKTYDITMAASDSGTGVWQLSALINHQGDNSAQQRGRFTWRSDGYAWTADQMPCAGGGYASKHPVNFNPETVTLIDCQSQFDGDQRTVMLTVRPEPGFGAFAENDISMWTKDEAGNLHNWTNYDLNFESVENLIANPGFEDGNTAPFVNSATRAVLSLESDPQHIRSGNHALRHETTDTWSFTNPWFGSNIVDAGGGSQAHTFTAWAKAETAAHVRMFVFCLDANQSTSADHYSSSSFNIGTEWQELNHAHYCPDSHPFVSVRLDGRDAGQVVWWDDLALFRTPIKVDFVTPDSQSIAPSETYDLGVIPENNTKFEFFIPEGATNLQMTDVTGAVTAEVISSQGALNLSQDVAFEGHISFDGNRALSTTPDANDHYPFAVTLSFDHSGETFSFGVSGLVQKNTANFQVTDALGNDVSFGHDFGLLIFRDFSLINPSNPAAGAGFSHEYPIDFTFKNTGSTMLSLRFPFVTERPLVTLRGAQIRPSFIGQSSGIDVPPNDTVGFAVFVDINDLIEPNGTIRSSIEIHYSIGASSQISTYSFDLSGTVNLNPCQPVCDGSHMAVLGAQGNPVNGEFKLRHQPGQLMEIPFEIINDGNMDVSNLAVTESGNSLFSVSMDPTPTSITPNGSSAAFKIQFDARVIDPEGVYRTRVAVTSSADNSPLEFNLIASNEESDSFFDVDVAAFPMADVQELPFFGGIFDVGDLNDPNLQAIDPATGMDPRDQRRFTLRIRNKRSIPMEVRNIAYGFVGGDGQPRTDLTWQYNDPGNVPIDGDGTHARFVEFFHFDGSIFPDANGGGGPFELIFIFEYRYLPSESFETNHTFKIVGEVGSRVPEFQVQVNGELLGENLEYDLGDIDAEDLQLDIPITILNDAGSRESLLVSDFFIRSFTAPETPPGDLGAFALAFDPANPAPPPIAPGQSYNLLAQLNSGERAQGPFSVELGFQPGDEEPLTFTLQGNLKRPLANISIGNTCNQTITPNRDIEFDSLEFQSGQTDTKTFQICNFGNGPLEIRELLLTNLPSGNGQPVFTLNTANTLATLPPWDGISPVPRTAFSVTFHANVAAGDFEAIFAFESNDPRADFSPYTFKAKGTVGSGLNSAIQILDPDGNPIQPGGEYVFDDIEELADPAILKSFSIKNLTGEPIEINKILSDVDADLPAYFDQTKPPFTLDIPNDLVTLPSCQQTPMDCLKFFELTLNNGQAGDFTGTVRISFNPIGSLPDFVFQVKGSVGTEAELKLRTGFPGSLSFFSFLLGLRDSGSTVLFDDFIFSNVEFCWSNIGEKPLFIEPPITTQNTSQGSAFSQDNNVINAFPYDLPLSKWPDVPVCFNVNFQAPTNATQTEYFGELNVNYRTQNGQAIPFFTLLEGTLLQNPEVADPGLMSVKGRGFAPIPKNTVISNGGSLELDTLATESQYLLEFEFCNGSDQRFYILNFTQRDLNAPLPGTGFGIAIPPSVDQFIDPNECRTFSLFIQTGDQAFNYETEFSLGPEPHGDPDNFTFSLSANSDPSAQPIPAVSLSSNGSVIPNHNAFEFSPTHLNVPLEQEFIIANNSPQTVAVDQVEFLGQGFELSQAPPPTIGPGGQASYRVMFDAAVVGQSTDTQVLSYGYVGESVYAYSVNLEGMAEQPINRPSMRISSQDQTPIAHRGRFQFEPASTPGPNTETFEIKNQGDIALQVQSLALTMGSQFRILNPPQTPFTLQPNQSQSFTLEFDDTLQGANTVGIDIHSNDSLHNPFNFEAQGPIFDPTPQNLIGLAVDGNQIALGWQPGQYDQSFGTLAGYRIYRAIGSGSMQLLGTNSANDTQFSDQTVEPNTTYHYEVTAFSATHESEPSNRITQTTPPLGDLRILNPNWYVVQHPARYAFSADLANIGGGPAIGTSTVKWFYSTNQSLDAGDLLLDDESESSLGAGGTTSTTGYVDFADYNFGPGYILMVADANDDIDESNENNNVTVVPNFSIPVLDGADLVVLGAAAERHAAPGGTVDLFAEVKNNGTTSTFGTSKLGIYLADNDIFDPPLPRDQTTLLKRVNVGNLAAGAQVRLDPIRVTIPSNTPPGTYVVGYEADYDNDINEGDENNNLQRMRIHVQHSPAAPANLNATDTLDNRIEITWDAVPGADTYVLWRNTENNPNTAEPYIPTSGTIHRFYTGPLSQARPNTTYYFWIQAQNEVGESDLSSVETGFIPDVNSPLMWIDTPANNTTQSGTIEISGWALDATQLDASHISFTLDGNPLVLQNFIYGTGRSDVCQVHQNIDSPNCNQVGWKGNLNTASFTHGAHQLKMIVTDDSGNAGELEYTINFSN